MEIALLVYFLFCVLVGFCGRYRALGFFGTFLASLIVSPLVVVIVLMLTAPSYESSNRKRAG
jgi:hypothetical protein